MKETERKKKPARCGMFLRWWIVAGKSFWVRIGAAFGNYDGSETVLLDALPLNGKMQIRTPVAKASAPKVKVGVQAAAVEGAADDDGD